VEHDKQPDLAAPAIDAEAEQRQRIFETALAELQAALDDLGPIESRHLLAKFFNLPASPTRH
jgi:hypothetical protein